MKVPLSWLNEYCAPDMPVAELATRLAMTGTEVDRIEHHGVRALEHFVVGRVLSAQQHPDADRLSVCIVDVGDGVQAQIVCGAPNVAAGQTVAVARPGLGHARWNEAQEGQAARPGVHGMILAEDELGIGMDHAGTMVLDDGLAIGSPLAGVLPISTDVLELEITPEPARLPRRLRRRARGARGDRRPARAAAVGRRPGDDGRGRRGHRRRDHRRGDRPLPALHGAGVRGRHDRALAALAEGASDGRRPAPDQQRRRHHQLRDAAHRPADARVRPRSHRGPPARRAPRDRRRTGRHARRPDPRRRRRRLPHRRRRRSDVDRRPDGRQSLRGAAGHDERSHGGGQLGRREHPRDVAEARAAQRGQRALREGPRARAGARRPGRGDAADARADRRAPRARHRRHRRARTAARRV